MIQTTRMITLAHQALAFSYSPYSQFAVACCIAAEDEALFLGVNVENAAYSLCICAETSALAQMIVAGKKSIRSLVILNSNNTLCPPCGACRQRISEFSSQETRIHLCNKENILQTLTMDQLLPTPFTSHSLD